MKEKDIVVYININYSNLKRYAIYIGEIVPGITSGLFDSVKIIRYITNEDYKPHEIGSIARLSKNSLHTIKEYHERFRYKIFSQIFMATRVK